MAENGTSGHIFVSRPLNGISWENNRSAICRKRKLIPNYKKLWKLFWKLKNNIYICIGFENEPHRPGGFREQKLDIMKAIDEIKNLAANFLNVADRLNESVSRYINGSDAESNERAYRDVLGAEKKFIDAVNAYYGEKFKCELNYELAESFI